jgi:hypothetical protein
MSAARPQASALFVFRMKPQIRALLLIATLGVVATVAMTLRMRRDGQRPRVANTAAPAVADQFLALEASEQAVSARDFKGEIDAGPAREALEEVWNRLNRDPDALNTMADLAPDRIEVAGLIPVGSSIIKGAEDFSNLASGKSWSRDGWQSQLREWHSTGWRVRRSRWDLLEWIPSPAESHFSFELLLERIPDGARRQLRGRAVASGNEGVIGTGSRIRIDALEALGIPTKPAMAVEWEVTIPMPPGVSFCDPLIAVPRRDGLGDDLLLVGAAIWLRQEADGWRTEPLLGLPAEQIWAATVVDWDADGHGDLLLAGSDGLRWLRGPGWRGPGQVLWVPPTKWRHPQVLAAADVDGDGDLDLFLGQYKLPFQGGQFPTPYHDANDGFESCLLRNDGPAGLRDTTTEAGLAAKRRRRIYSASFADLNDDGHPDLVLVSDFAGVDLFLNNGQGQFTDVTTRLGDDRHLFGMAHLTGDFNDDGRTDLFAIGMGSPTASRLDRMGQVRSGWPDDRRLRPAMTAGNRMFLGTPGGLRMAPWAAQVASGGWAWAVTAIDPDNEGFLDFHLCNGHETRENVGDYERQFWMHDIHVAGSTNNPVAELYFRNAAGKRAADRASYGGWQNGAFFQRAGEGRYVEAGWLAGSVIPADTRNAVALDVGNDGRMDLAVTTFEEWPARRQRLILLRNRVVNPGNWIGIDLGDGVSDVRVRIKSGGVTRERRLMPGESYRSQTVGRLHFGLGTATGVESVELQLPRKQPRSLTGLHVNRWNRVETR